MVPVSLKVVPYLTRSWQKCEIIENNAFSTSFYCSPGEAGRPGWGGDVLGPGAAWTRLDREFRGRVRTPRKLVLRILQSWRSWQAWLASMLLSSWRLARIAMMLDGLLDGVEDKSCSLARSTPGGVGGFESF